MGAKPYIKPTQDLTDSDLPQNCPRPWSTVWLPAATHSSLIFAYAVDELQRVHTSTIDPGIPSFVLMAKPHPLYMLYHPELKTSLSTTWHPHLSPVTQHPPPRTILFAPHGETPSIVPAGPLTLPFLTEAYSASLELLQHGTTHACLSFSRNIARLCFTDRVRWHSPGHHMVSDLTALPQFPLQPWKSPAMPDHPKSCERAAL